MYKARLISADFEESTMEFSIQDEFTVKKGDYVILSKEEFEGLADNDNREWEPFNKGHQPENGSLFDVIMSNGKIELNVRYNYILNEFCKFKDTDPEGVKTKFIVSFWRKSKIY